MSRLAKLFRKTRRLLGLAELREEFAGRVRSQFGEDAVDDFLAIYDRINSGTPVGFGEAIVVVHLVEETKDELRKATIFSRLARRLLGED